MLISDIAKVAQWIKLRNDCTVDTDSNDFESQSLKLNIFGNELNLAMMFQDAPAKLADIVPAARQLSDIINNVVIEHNTQNDNPVSCCAGCCHCCNYIVPISPAEAFQIKQEVLSMPRKKSTKLIRKCTIASRKILNNVPSLPIPSDNQADTTIHRMLEQLSQWYTSLDISCPFLSDNHCRIYENRPLACREHFVVSPPECCEFDFSTKAQKVTMPVRISDVLTEMCSNLLDNDNEAIMLPLSIAWCNTYYQIDECSWPAGQLVETFIETIHRHLEKNETADLLVGCC